MKYTKLCDSLRTKRWLLSNLHRFSTSECSVCHDLVYELMSRSCGFEHAKYILAKPDCLRHLLSVNYQQSVDELFLFLARLCVHEDAIAVLASAAIRIFINSCFEEYGEGQPSACFCYDNIHLWSEEAQQQAGFSVNEELAGFYVQFNASIFFIICCQRHDNSPSSTPISYRCGLISFRYPKVETMSGSSKTC